MVPEGWAIQPVAELGRVVTGSTPKTKEPSFWDGGTIPFVTPGDLSELSYVRTTDRCVTEEGLASSQELPPGAVFVTCIASIGKNGIATSRCCSNQQINAVVPSDDVSSEFLYYALTSSTDRLLRMAGQTALAIVSKGKFSAFEVPVPPLPEQRKIAAILGSVDALIERTQAVIDQVEVVKKGLMLELLTRGLPGHHTRFKKTEIGEIPESWEVAGVGEVLDVANRHRKPIKRANREQIPGPYPYYGPTKVIDYIAEYRLEGRYALIGEDGDHFLKWDRWPMTQLVSGRFNVNNHAHVLGGTERCSPDWFALFFRHRDIVPMLTRQGTTRYKLNKATLTALPLAVPPPDEQQGICKVVDGLELRLASEMKMMVGLRDLKSALSSVLLSGEVRVQTDDSEVTT